MLSTSHSLTRSLSPLSKACGCSPQQKMSADKTQGLRGCAGEGHIRDVCTTARLENAASGLFLVALRLGGSDYCAENGGQVFLDRPLK